MRDKRGSCADECRSSFLCGKTRPGIQIKDPSSGETDTAKKILIVEDNEDCRVILGSVLRCAGYEIVEVETGAEAIAKTISATPDLVIMDLDLPDMKGTDAARALKKNVMTAPIPIIAYSAWSAREWGEEARAAGMVDYLEKPTQADQIRAKVERFIGPRKCETT